MLAQEFMRNALLAGTFVALACGVGGWFLVLRGQVFAGDALGHVAFPGALAAAAASVDERVGLFAVTIAVGAALGALGRGVPAPRAGRMAAAVPANDTSIGIVFTFVLALGVLFLTIFDRSAQGGAGIQAARTLFGSIFALDRGEALTAAGVGAGALLVLAAIARPLLFASVAPQAAAARGVPTRALGIAFLALVGALAAEASQAVGALLLLGLLTAPAAAAHRLARAPAAGIALAGALALVSAWGGLALAYAVPSLPPSCAIVAVAIAVYCAARTVAR